MVKPNMQKPAIKPKNPNFSSGPAAKRPGWTLDKLSNALVGRSHRSKDGKEKLKAVIDHHRSLLGIPADYKIAIVPGSNTGAFEMAMWSMLGARGVDVFGWEVFSNIWVDDITQHLKIDDVRTFQAEYGKLPDLSQADPSRDCVFVWNGTTSGVRVPDGNWISDKREGLTFCDATSAVFAYDLPWDKLDVTTWSWQKVLGGEAAHGMIVLSPRAVERLESYTPENRPLPRIFRMTKGAGDNKKLNEGLFLGETLNTPSMLSVEDCLDALDWVDHCGGLEASTRRVEINYSTIEKWVQDTDWIDFLATDENIRSKTSVCLKIVDGWFASLSPEGQKDFIKSMTQILEDEDVAHDIKSHRDAPMGLRVWCGATVSMTDLQEVTPWLDWAFENTKAQMHGS